MDADSAIRPFYALLLQVPPGDVTGPYPALAYLKSFAGSRGHAVKIKDLGIEALHHLSQPRHVADMIGRAEALCARLEAMPSLDADRQRHYGLLLRALAAGRQPDWMIRGINFFREPGRFFDYGRYQKACHALNAFYNLLSAVHYPTVLTPAEYPAATLLKTLEAVLTHCDPRINPYLRYYEEVLFPQIKANPPALVGISMVFANQSVQALVLGRLIKERFPEIHVTLGGAYLSQWAMTAGESILLELLTCADSIICGEGEQAMVDLLERVSQKRSLCGLPNTICRDDRTGRLQCFDQLRYTDIAEQPPPDFSDLDMRAYLTPQIILPYSISRGCYWGRCVFCQNRYGDHRMRRYQTVPVDKAIAEMARLSTQYGSHHFNFSNDVIDPAYLKKFSRALLDTGKQFVWNTDLRAEAAFDEPTCRLMARAGLNSAAIGFESGCQKTLDAMDKGKRVATTRAVMRNLYQAGVATQAMGIFGMPGETETDGAETVRFIEENAAHISYYVMGLLMVLPGSRMHSDPQAHGVSAISYAATPLKTPEPVWQSPTRMSVHSVNRLYERLNRLEQFYAINEYPYVGGLCTNHGFLYYTRGPDILKRLRSEEQTHLSRQYQLLGTGRHAQPGQALKKRVLRPGLPCRIHPSPYPADRLPLGDTPDPRYTFAISPGAVTEFLISPTQSAVAVGPVETHLLRRMDNHRTLYAVLKKINGPDMPRALAFLRFLIAAGLITLR